MSTLACTAGVNRSHAVAPDAAPLFLDFPYFFHGYFSLIEGFACNGSIHSHGRQFPEIFCAGDAAGSNQVDAFQSLKFFIISKFGPESMPSRLMSV